MARPPPLTNTDPSTGIPMPLLPWQEAEIRELYHKRIRKNCAEEMRQFAMCMHGRTFSMAWSCKPEKKAMVDCGIANRNMIEEDSVRAEWLASAEQREQEKEAKKLARESEKRKHHDWWGLDESGRRVKFDGPPPPGQNGGR